MDFKAFQKLCEKHKLKAVKRSAWHWQISELLRTINVYPTTGTIHINGSGTGQKFFTDFGAQLPEGIEKAIKLVQTEKPDSKNFRMPFGKHRGATIDEIYHEDNGYLEWILNSFEQENTIYKNVERYMEGK